MKGLRAPAPIAILLTGWSLLMLPVARAQTLLLDTSADTYSERFGRGLNHRSFMGIPISPVPGQPPGSSGTAPVTPTATPNQYAGVTVSSGVVRPQASSQFVTAPDGTTNIAANAANLNLPRGGGMILRAARVGAGQFGRQHTHLFGAIIVPPSTDESGKVIPEALANSYWNQEPHVPQGQSDVPYYYSPHIRKVFATQSGPVSVIWKTVRGTPVTPLDFRTHPERYSLESGLYFSLTNVTYVVAGTPAKPSRRIFWTEGSYNVTGKAIDVPASRVNDVKVVYNPSFPKLVDSPAPGVGGDLPVAGTNRFQELRTLWYDTDRRQILACNREGRVFMELLGETVEPGRRRHLGYEIVDVYQQAQPVDAQADLGDRILPPEGVANRDRLTPSPIPSLLLTTRIYGNPIAGGATQEFFATGETSSMNEVMLHWLETGEQGLLWPSLLARYRLTWPSDPQRYSHYIRPRVGSEAEASRTAVQMPAKNAPILQCQDALDRPRGFLVAPARYYSFLDSDHPAHRALIRLTAGGRVAFERVFSWLDSSLASPGALSGSVATNLVGWDGSGFPWTAAGAGSPFTPRFEQSTAVVGSRIEPPEDDSRIAAGARAGYILASGSDSYDPTAYVDPFASGFGAASSGAIIPVNAIPGTNQIRILWFRASRTDAVKNTASGFDPIYWPEIMTYHDIRWPEGGDEIVMASNRGSGLLSAEQSMGTIYTQNDPSKPGYNPNEEHALLIAGQAFALRDDLNLFRDPRHYSSHPFVLLRYAAVDRRPAIRCFRVLREKPEAGQVFDYVVTAGGNRDRSGAGSPLQAPMPLPLLPPPVLDGVNYNVEPASNSMDLPPGIVTTRPGLGAYGRFTFIDRKQNIWVVRGMHSGLPALEAGSFSSDEGTFQTNLPLARAVIGQPFTNHIHTSRLPDSLTAAVVDGRLPDGLSIQGMTIAGIPLSAGTHQITVRISDLSDGSSAVTTMAIEVVGDSFSWSQGPLTVQFTNRYTGNPVLLSGRPPFLAGAPSPTNSFTLRFYYRNQEGFAFPGQIPPPPGAIIPYLRPLNPQGTYSGDGALRTTPSLDIVYRPVWPSDPPTMAFAETLTTAKGGLPAIRGQSSVEILYQQSVALAFGKDHNETVQLFDPTCDKTFALGADGGMAKLPDSIRQAPYLGRVYFPGLPPHLSQRFFYDPNRGPKGALVLQGRYQDSPTGEGYLFLNVLTGHDLDAVKSLCPSTDMDSRALWENAIEGLTAVVQTYGESVNVTGQFGPVSAARIPARELCRVTSSDVAVDSYALSASGPGSGYVTWISGNGRAFTSPDEPVTLHVARVGGRLHAGEVKVLFASNPLDEQVTLLHTADVAGKFADYEYEWRVAPPLNGRAPPVEDALTAYQPLDVGVGVPQHVLGGSGIQTLIDNHVILRYRPVSALHPLQGQWSAWSQPQFVPGWIKRVVTGINPFNQRVSDLFNNPVNRETSVLTAAGRRWEGDVALNLENIDSAGLIEIYETVLSRGRGLSIDAGINFGPANDALLLAAGYLRDLYSILGDEAWADAMNPSIGIGTKDSTYGDIATSLFAFGGQVPTLGDEELVLLRGRDDSPQPGVVAAPVYNRMYWNYSGGIDSGEAIYAINYNIRDENEDGRIDAADAAILFPQGHGDAYGHYLTALKGYYSLLTSPSFEWVPRSETVSILGQPVSIDYLDERRFAKSALAVSRVGRQVLESTWRKSYIPMEGRGWSHLSATSSTGRIRQSGTNTAPITSEWGVDQWGARTATGSFLHWVVGNSLLPERDEDPRHQGIQRVDRQTVPELVELAAMGQGLQSMLDNAEGGSSPLGIDGSDVPFDINPQMVVGANAQTHFEQVYGRALLALKNAVAAFDDAKDVTRRMRAEQDSATDLRYTVLRDEITYTNSLIELYGTPYMDDIGPGKTYRSGYVGPDLVHFMYTDLPEPALGLDQRQTLTYRIDLQKAGETWFTELTNTFNTFKANGDSGYTNYIELELSPHGYFTKPVAWTGQRQSPGSLQVAIQQQVAAHQAVQNALVDAERAKLFLDRAVLLFEKKKAFLGLKLTNELKILSLETDVERTKLATEVGDKWLDAVKETVDGVSEALIEGVPHELIVGLADGGDLTSLARGGIGLTKAVVDVSVAIGAAAILTGNANKITSDVEQVESLKGEIASGEYDEELYVAVNDLGLKLEDVWKRIRVVNERLHALSEAQLKVRALVDQGRRIQAERLVARQRNSAVIQGYRTREITYRAFRDEKLERYKTLFDLAARYALVAANAYGYETGLLQTEKGRGFINRIVSSRALGVMVDGEPGFGGSGLGDPGLSSTLAEMKADWDVVRRRLGFNNPDAYGTTVSLRSGNFRISSGTNGIQTWQDLLHAASMPDLRADPDVRRLCLGMANTDGLPIPGILIAFSTEVTPGKNLFGRPLAAGDSSYDPSTFSTRIWAIGVALEGYRGMLDPTSNGSSSSDPSQDSLALSATPYVYLIPTGMDRMRSSLGNTGEILSWNVRDLTIPLPFNIGGSDFSTKESFVSADSLSEPLLDWRRHQAFRPVPTTSAFSTDLFGATGSLRPSQFTNQRLIGRSVWNTQWKLVIPADRLLADPAEGLERLIQTVTDIHLRFVTYGYSGN